MSFNGIIRKNSTETRDYKIEFIRVRPKEDAFITPKSF